MNETIIKHKHALSFKPMLSAAASSILRHEAVKQLLNFLCGGKFKNHQMNKQEIHDKIFTSLTDFIQHEEVKKVLSTSIVEPPNYYLLNPQVKISLYMTRDNELIAKTESNGDDGFTEFKKTYQL